MLLWLPLTGITSHALHTLLHLITV